MPGEQGRPGGKRSQSMSDIIWRSDIPGKHSVPKHRHVSDSSKFDDVLRPTTKVASVSDMLQNKGQQKSSSPILRKKTSASTYRPLPGSEKIITKHAPRQSRRRKVSFFGRHFSGWKVRVVTGCLVTVLLTGGFIFGKGYFELRSVFRGNNGRVTALQADQDPGALRGEGDGRINILLLGIGGGNHSAPDLTDTIMVASIDPVNNSAVLLSVPRDLWVKMPTPFMGNYQKINAAYEAGKYDYLKKQDASNTNFEAVSAGFKAANQTVSNVLGVPIHYNVLLNFQAFKQAIDTVGGVKVNVPDRLYDPTMAWENKWNPVLAEAGVQTMDGKQALMYVRSRETSSDFARSDRQRSVMLGLKDKALTLGTLSNPVKIASLMEAFGENVRTDISLTDAQALYALMKKINNNNIKTVGLADPPASYVKTGAVQGVSAVQPIAGTFEYGPIQQYVRGMLRDGYLAKENAKIAIINSGSQGNGAAALGETMKSYGYNVTMTVEMPGLNTYQKTTVIDMPARTHPYTKNYLEKRFKSKTVNSLADKSIHPKDADFVIIIGKNETSRY